MVGLKSVVRTAYSFKEMPLLSSSSADLYTLGDTPDVMTSSTALSSGDTVCMTPAAKA